MTDYRFIWWTWWLKTHLTDYVFTDYVSWFIDHSLCLFHISETARIPSVSYKNMTYPIYKLLKPDINDLKLPCRLFSGQLQIYYVTKPLCIRQVWLLFNSNLLDIQNWDEMFVISSWSSITILVNHLTCNMLFPG